MAAPAKQFTRIVSSRYQVEGCAFSPSGDLLAACFSDGSVRLYNIEVPHNGLELSASVKHCFREHQSNVWSVSFSPDGEILSSCSSDKSVVIYSVHSLSVINVLKIHSGVVWCCRFSVLSVLATCSNDCTVKIINPRIGEVIHCFANFKARVESLDFSKEGTMLCTAAQDGQIRVWTNISKGSCPVNFLVLSDKQTVRLCRFVLIEEQEFILYSSNDHSVRSLDISRIFHTQNNGTVLNSDVSSDCDADGYIDMTSVVTEMHNFRGHYNIVWETVCVKKDTSRLLITCSGDRTIR